MPLGKILSRNIALITFNISKDSKVNVVRMLKNEKLTELLPFDVRPKNATFMWSRASTSRMLLILNTKLRNASVSALSTMSPWPWLSARAGIENEFSLHRIISWVIKWFLTFDEARRFHNIVADITKNIINVFLSFHEDLKWWVNVLKLTRVCVDQGVVISGNHRCSAC